MGYTTSYWQKERWSRRVADMLTSYGLWNPRRGIVCSLCSQPFILTYTDTGWNKLNEWRRLARAALRDSHKLRYEEFPLEPVWKMKYKR